MVKGMCTKCVSLVSDNGFSQIFYNYSNVDEIFSLHNLASSLSQKLKMCSKNFENWLTSKKVLDNNIFNRDFLYKKSHGREVNIFPQKFQILRILS